MVNAADEIQDTNEQLNWHWRNSMRVVRFFGFDARSSFVVIIIFFRMFDPIAYLIVFTILAIFRYVERKGLTFPAALRNLRMWIVGHNRPGLIGVDHRKFRDFG